MKLAAQRRSPQRPSLQSADPEALSRDELRRLAKAERKLESPDHAQSAAARRDLKDIERRHSERLDAQSLAARLIETAALARGRGEEVRSESVRIAVPLLDEHGARVVARGLPQYRQETVSRVRIASRGGLQRAFDRGDLEGGPAKPEHLFEIGKAYRAAFETASALTTPVRNLAPISAHAPLRASAGPQDAVFAAGEILRVLRAGLTPRQVAVLDHVCGHDETLAVAAATLKLNPRPLRRALVKALTAAAENRRTSAPPARRD